MVKKTTIEDLARMTQNEFLSVHKDLSGLGTEMSELRKEVRDGFASVQQALKGLHQTILYDHEERLRRIEHKLGLAVN